MVKGIGIAAVVIALFSFLFSLVGVMYTVFGPNSFKKRTGKAFILFVVAAILGACYWLLTH